MILQATQFVCIICMMIFQIVRLIELRKANTVADKLERRIIMTGVLIVALIIWYGGRL